MLLFLWGLYEILPAFWHRTVLWKVLEKSLENNCDGVLLQEIAGCDLTEKKVFVTVSFEWNFSDQLYCKTSPVEYYCSFQAFMRFYQCSERSHSIHLSKFGQLSLHSSATTTIIRLIKQLKIPHMQLLGPILWNSSPEKKSEYITFSRKPLCWTLVW